MCNCNKPKRPVSNSASKEPSAAAKTRETQTAKRASRI